MNTKAPRWTLPLTLCLLAGGPVGGIAQPQPLAYHLETYAWTAGERGAGAKALPAVRHRVSAEGAAWLRVHFEPALLGAESFVLLMSLLDGATQRLDGAALRQWRNTSAYFNGDAVEVALFVAPNDAGVHVGIDRLVVGEWAGGESLDGDNLCGPTDDRAPSSHPAVGRLPNAGCTAWVATSGNQVTAGHCVGHGADVVEFDIPPSLADGTIQHPGPEDQYAVDPDSIQSGAGGTDDDWGTFAVFDNPVTGLQPVEAQGGGLGIAQSAGSAWTRVTGCGVDMNDPQRNRTQQTHVGPSAGLAGNIISYRADTTTGNSGSPVIDEAAGVAIGVHNTSACTPDGGGEQRDEHLQRRLLERVDRRRHPAGLEDQRRRTPLYGRGRPSFHRGSPLCAGKLRILRWPVPALPPAHRQHERRPLVPGRAPGADRVLLLSIRRGFRRVL
jgi:hypothetical protein